MCSHGMSALPFTGTGVGRGRIAVSEESPILVAEVGTHTCAHQLPPGTSLALIAPMLCPLSVPVSNSDTAAQRAVLSQDPTTSTKSENLLSEFWWLHSSNAHIFSLRKIV